MDTKLRELEVSQTRLFKPLTGVPSTPDENNVYEYGRLSAMQFFGAMSREALDQAKSDLGIDSEEKERIAANVMVIYQYLEYQNRRDFDGILRIHHNPYMNKTYFGRWPIDPEAHARGLRGWFQVTPDATTEANKIIVATDHTVVVRTTARGTLVRSFTNSMLGQSGKQYAVALIHSIDVINGAVASCESTSPFENQWEEQLINSNFPGLGGDISEVRARQGVTADFEYLAEQVIGDDTMLRMYPGSDRFAPLARAEQTDVLAIIQKLHSQGPNQCQTLIPPKMRRCAKVRVGDALYCQHHQEHGYGIDDLY
jgi:hypothetical protein